MSEAVRVVYLDMDSLGNVTPRFSNQEYKNNTGLSRVGAKCSLDFKGVSLEIYDRKDSRSYVEFGEYRDNETMRKIVAFLKQSSKFCTIYGTYGTHPNLSKNTNPYASWLTWRGSWNSDLSGNAVIVAEEK